MLIYLFGGSDSGKSAFAESLVGDFAGSEKEKIYLATMDGSKEYNRATIQGHLTRRAGKNFRTIECPYDLHEAVQVLRGEDETCESGRVILLECLSNLVSNQLFGEDSKWSQNYMTGGNSQVLDAIHQADMHGIRELENCCDTLIIVGNNLFEDGGEYDELTTGYMKALSALQSGVAASADEVYEVVAGIVRHIR